MPLKKLTPVLLRNLRPPAGSAVDEVLDTVSRGLSLRVFASGRASWSFRYRPRH
jgi:hypothetical protein